MVPITCNAVGDILALATLVLDIAHAFNECRGSTAKYRVLNSELKSLHIVLASVSRVAELTTDLLLRDEIVREVDRCGSDVRRALERVAKFSALGRDATVEDELCFRIKRQWYKLEWRFGWRGSVDTIREELASATQRLTAYLVIANADGIQNLGVSIASQFDSMTARICMLVMNQFAAAATRDAALSRTLHSNAVALKELRLASSRALNGLDSSKAAASALLCLAMFSSRASAGPADFALLLAAFTILMCSMARDGQILVSDLKYTRSNSITLYDAMGRQLTLPLELCETYELFHGTLVNLFSRTNGRWFIDTRKYALQRKGDALYLGYSRWTQCIRPNTEVEMTILLQSGSKVGGVRCPVCSIKVQMHRTDLCVWCSSGCGRQLRSYAEPSDPLSSFLDSAQGGPGAAKGTEYDVDDLGRFPRARPISTPGNTEREVHIPPSIQHANPSKNDREQPFNSDKQPDIFLNWRNQVQGFTRFSTQSSARPFSLKDSPELCLAAEHGHYALVFQLVQLGDVDIDASAGRGFTALHLATLSGHTRIVKLLLDYKAAVDATTEDDDTPLAFAARFRRPEIAALLLARGSMVNASERMRAVVFFDAVRFNDLSIVRGLLHLGFNVDVLMHGQTALHTALRFRHRDVVQVLLQNRADATVRDGHGDTALSIVARQGQAVFETFALLCASGAMIKCTSPSDSGRLFYRAVDGGSLTIVEMVLQHTRADVNARFEDGSTPLSLASELGHDEVVALLLAQGADPNAEAMPSQKAERQGLWKALHAAARNGHVKVVQMLLQRGADVNARAENSDTALSLAMERDPPRGVAARAELDHDKARSSLAFAKEGNRIPPTWRTKASDYDRIVSMLISGGAVMDDRTSLLLKEMESAGNSSVGLPDLEVPGAWR